MSLWMINGRVNVYLAMTAATSVLILGGRRAVFNIPPDFLLCCTMGTTWFFVLCFACFASFVLSFSIPAHNEEENKDSIMGTFTKWLPLSMPESLAKPYDIAQESKPTDPEETAQKLMDVLANPSQYIPNPKTAVNYMADRAGKAKEEAKQKAMRDMCELIKVCLKSYFWG